MQPLKLVEASAVVVQKPSLQMGSPQTLIMTSSAVMENALLLVHQAAVAETAGHLTNVVKTHILVMESSVP